jgi:hypothetical protein
MPHTRPSSVTGKSDRPSKIGHSLWSSDWFSTRTFASGRRQPGCRYPYLAATQIAAGDAVRSAIPASKPAGSWRISVKLVREHSLIYIDLRVVTFAQ